MNKVVKSFDAKTHLSKYIQQAKEGQPVYIGSYGKQEVVLIDAKPAKSNIKLGTASGKFKYSIKNLEDIDSDIQELFFQN